MAKIKVPPIEMSLKEEKKMSKCERASKCLFTKKKKFKKYIKYLMNECERVWCVVCERKRALKVNVVNNKL